MSASMTNDEFEASLRLGYEQRGVEFKGPGSLGDSHFAAKATRAVLAMANRRGGGTLIIGVEDKKTALNAVGLSDSQLESWKHDDVADKLATYADPYVSFDLEYFEFEDRRFVIVRVHEFEEIPVLCKKQFDPVLRKGACYVRSMNKPESVQVGTQEDMRELIELATEKRLRRFIAQARAAGLDVSGGSAVTDGGLFDRQLEDFLN
jgi:predicted HTH transcriptional regulator